VSRQPLYVSRIARLGPSRLASAMRLARAEAHDRVCAMDRDGVLNSPDQWMIEATLGKARDAAE